MIPSLPDPVRLLAFDSSSSSLHLCLLENGGSVLAEVIESRHGGRQEAQAMLMPAIDSALKKIGWRKEELSCLVVGRGPGSFTGIRTGLVTARTLANALNLPLIGLSVFECFAARVNRPVGIVLYCGPGFYFAAAYLDGPYGELTPVLAPAYLSESALSARLNLTYRWLADDQSRDLFYGRRATTGLHPSGNGAGPEFELEPLPDIKNLAEIQAQIAWDRLSLRVPGNQVAEDIKGLAERYHWSQIEPLYLRGPSVTIKRNV